VKRLKQRLWLLRLDFERKTGVIFGTQKAPNPQDFLFIIRLGAGKRRKLINFEASVVGRGIYVSNERRLMPR
jgi:hypothetical protein